MASAALQAVIDGRATYTWADIGSEHSGKIAAFRMLVDALMVDGVREVFSPREAQLAATHLSALLPTPRLLDLRYTQATAIAPPQPMNYRNEAERGTRAAIDAHSRRVGAAVGQQAGLVQNVGKHWVLDNQTTPARAVLYGWHVPTHRNSLWKGIPVAPSTSTPDLWVIQQATPAHRYDYADYAMTLMLVHEDCTVDGAPAKVADVLIDPTLCGLATSPARPLRSVMLPVGP